MVAAEELEPSKEHSLLITVAKSNFLSSTPDFHEGVFDCPTFWCQVLVVAGKPNSSYTLRSDKFVLSCTHTHASEPLPIHGMMTFYMRDSLSS